METDDHNFRCTHVVIPQPFWPRPPSQGLVVQDCWTSCAYSSGNCRKHSKNRFAGPRFLSDLPNELNKKSGVSRRFMHLTDTANRYQLGFCQNEVTQAMPGGPAIIRTKVSTRPSCMLLCIPIQCHQLNLPLFRVIFFTYLENHFAV